MSITYAFLGYNLLAYLYVGELGIHDDSDTHQWYYPSDLHIHQSFQNVQKC